MKGMSKTQKRLASKLLSVGEKKVWLDPSKHKEISEAITRSDVQSLISRGIIKKRQYIGQSRGRARAFHLKRRKGHGKGIGSRKGGKHVRAQFEWVDKVRALRKDLAKQRVSGNIDKKEFRRLYSKIKGNSFHSVSHMRNYIAEMKKGAV